MISLVDEDRRVKFRCFLRLCIGGVCLVRAANTVSVVCESRDDEREMADDQCKRWCVNVVHCCGHVMRVHDVA